MMKRIIKLALSDFKLIFRDPSLKSFLFLPILLFIIIIWAVPYLVDKYDFLIPYLPVMLVVAAIENTQMFSFISSMVLIDEKETEVAKVYGIIPLSKPTYLLSRFIIPYTFTVLINVILFAVQPFFTINLGINLLLSCLVAMVVPVYAMAVNCIVENRMQGMVYIKAFNILVLLPIAAFFVPENIKHLFGFLPTHWLFQSIAHVTQGLPMFLMAGISLAFFTFLMWFTANIFMRKHFI